jgi:tetratricopeptide (TPR) repeat protein
MQAFGRYLAATQGGADPVDAFEPAFGMSPNLFADELRRYLRRGLQGFVLERPEIAQSEIVVTRMTRAADDLLPYVLQMRRNRRDEDESEARRASRDRTLIETVTRLAQDHPLDPFAQRARARAALLGKATDEARAILEPVLAANPEDVEALQLLGLSYLVEAREGDEASFTATAAQGRPFLVRAFRVEPNHVPTLYTYAATFSGEPGPLADAPLDVLTQAHLLAPQAHEIRLNLGGELIEAGRFDEAIYVLSPAAYAPHNSVLSRQARVMLDAARQGEVPSPEALAAAADDR